MASTAGYSVADRIRFHTHQTNRLQYLISLLINRPRSPQSSATYLVKCIEIMATAMTEQDHLLEYYFAAFVELRRGREIELPVMRASQYALTSWHEFVIHHAWNAIDEVLQHLGGVGDAADLTVITQQCAFSVTDRLVLALEEHAEDVADALNGNFQSGIQNYCTETVRRELQVESMQALLMIDRIPPRHEARQEPTDDDETDILRSAGVVRNPERDAWIYNAMLDTGRTLRQICDDLAAIAKQTGWRPIRSPQGLRSPAEKHAKRSGLPIPPARKDETE